MPNPASLSADIGGLFPEGVAAAELRIPGDPSCLYPEESALVVRAVPKRVQEFAAGRLCARRALTELGITDFALRARSDRVPLWPESAVGSITHTAGFCAAAVAERRRFAALGLDAEVVGDLKRELWPRICGAAEMAWLEAMCEVAQPGAATLIFSAKEAFYKCQYPVTGERLSFSDVCVRPVDSAALGGDGEAGALEVLPTRSLAIPADMTSALRARYRFLGPHVAVAVWLPAVSTPCRPGTISPPS